MIQQLSNKYRKLTAFSLFCVFYLNMFMPVFAKADKRLPGKFYGSLRETYTGGRGNYTPGNRPVKMNSASTAENDTKSARPANDKKTADPDIGGPSQPEMSAFKSVGVDNMVNLFTGDFSYNIPLLDVGGYPVNIFYDGGVGMEQEASWVGLGWNINPGTVSRNMRGVPDDFNGDEKLVQIQDMKPNITWGVNLGGDIELIGTQIGVGATMGVSFNNYLGPAIEAGVKGNISASLTPKAGSEKSTSLDLKLGVSVNASSRSGVSFSPSVSLTAKSHADNKGSTVGFGTHLSTSYNSRTGVKGIQLSEQASFNYGMEKSHQNDKNEKVVDWKNTSSISSSILSSSISFSKPSYVPAIRMPLTNKAFSGRFELGGGIFGTKASAEVEVYKQSSKIAPNDKTQIKPLVGYMYLERAKTNPNAVMDFTRFNDNEVTPSTPVISAPQYSYDVFSIQGEGTGGTIRAYRNDDGYVRDNKTGSRDESVGLGADIGVPGHYGASFNIVKTPSTIGEWGIGNKLRGLPGFKSTQTGTWENVYFRNPGETSVQSPAQYDKIGGTDLVRFKLGGTDKTPAIEPILERFTKAGYANGTTNLALTVAPPERKKRTQVINFLNAEEASLVGLDKKIKSYDGTTVLDNDNKLNFTQIDRYETTFPTDVNDNLNLSQYRRKNHISQINVTEADGQRYVYGIPVYNLRQKDFTFTVATDINDNDADKVGFSANNTTDANSVSNKDGYIQTTITPAYTHSFLLSGLLSPDYVDVTGDGITEDDAGNAVKFNYTKMNELSRWRTPLTSDMRANFNAGKRTEIKDDKGIVSFGIRESWYLHSIESKTMIALFSLENRNDGKGAGTGSGTLTDGELSGINANDNSAKRLKKIDLYSKADLKKNGLAGAKPIKTVHFEYSYTLCKGTPNNVNAGEGKLTLNKIYFTFNGKNRANKNQYVFAYGNAPSGPTAAENPDYSFNASDRWGTYKPASQNPPLFTGTLRNADYPYSVQDKTQADANAGAWMLKKILLPSGGQIEVTYESDDYAFVQNKRAAVMTKVLGFGQTSVAAPGSSLYNYYLDGIKENDYAFIQVTDACVSKQDVYEKYLRGLEQLAFRLKVKMPKGYEYINSYAIIDNTNPNDNYGVYTTDATGKTIWVKLKRVDDIGPLSLTAIEFLREQLPAQAYPGYDVSDQDGLDKVGSMIAGWLDGISSAFKSPVKHLRQQSLAQDVDLNACFVRLNDPDGIKYGGGYRVKKVQLKDNWQEMNGGALYTSVYGKEYDYSTKEIFNGTERTISSGVASYEPSLGGDENPFQTMIQIANKVPLGPASYGSVEMPMLDAFFPAPSVGYSKVTVRSIKKGTQNPNQKPKSGIGKQVTEFYTAKDYPVYYSYTPLDPASDKTATSSNLGIFFYKYSFDSRALSQGFLVATNDMHGKMKSQASYPENDETTPLNFTQNFYRNTGEKGLDEKFDFVNASSGGTIAEGNMGIDIELMTDTREFSVKGTSFDVQGQLDLFPVFGIAPWFAFIWPVSGTSENVYRAVTTTKVISYHSILDSVVVIDKGSQVSTKNLVYDAETGSVVVNRTNNEFKKPVYSTNYPAYWGYSGMGLAYKNIDVRYDNVNFYDGVPNISMADFESGDEIFISKTGSAPSSPCNTEMISPATVRVIWALDKNKNTSPLTNPSPNFIFIDEAGKPYTRNGVSIRVIRSGHRNMLGAQAASLTSLTSTIIETPVLHLGLQTSKNQILNASAIEYKEKWQADNDVFKRYTTQYDPQTCTTTVTENCAGILQSSFNPYVKGMLGTFRPDKSRVFYAGRKENNPDVGTVLPEMGTLSDFSLYWDFDASSNLVPNTSNNKWVFQSQITRVNSKGLELETKDALDIYTSAQYGFNKTVPVAIANNSKFNEMFQEGFEDKDYNESINGAVQNTCFRHIDFSNIANTSIVNTEDFGVRAHSGKMALKVDVSAVKNISIESTIATDFDLQFNQGVSLSAVQPAGTYQKLSSLPANEPVPSVFDINFGTGSLAMNYKVETVGHHSNPFVDVNANGIGNLRMFYKTIQYFKVITPGTYAFNLNTHQNVIRDHLVSNPEPPVFNRTALTIAIKKLSGETVYTTNLYSDEGVDPLTWNTQKSKSVNVSLQCAGDYIIESYPSGDYTALAVNNTLYTFLSEASYSVNPALYSYVPGCTYTKPIAADKSMHNPVFSLEPGKKMLLSAWVKEDCSAPCYKQTYAGTGISVNFNNGGAVTLLPSGPIIDGWQKVEGVFTAPARAANMTITFLNSTGQPAYFDDIRIHPYNANMKSYVYDPVNLRLTAQLDANNYASFYEYDEEGTLIRTKVETKEGIKTVTETRSAKQKTITAIQ